MFSYAPTYKIPKAKCWICQKDIRARVSIAWAQPDSFLIQFECCNNKEEHVWSEKQIDEINNAGHWMAFLS